MRARRLVFAAAAALAGCSMVAPYPTSPAETEKGQPRGTRVALCYDRFASSPAEVQKSAQEQCPPGSRASLLDTDYHLDYCPLLLPAHATFVCLRQKK